MMGLYNVAWAKKSWNQGQKWKSTDLEVYDGLRSTKSETLSHLIQLRKGMTLTEALLFLRATKAQGRQ